MAVFRRRPTDAPCEGHPHLGAIERERTDWGVVKILAVFALFVAVGLWYYFKEKEISADGTVVQSSGSGSHIVPDSNENRPSPPRINPPAQPASPKQQ